MFGNMAFNHQKDPLGEPGDGIRDKGNGGPSKPQAGPESSKGLSFSSPVAKFYSSDHLSRSIANPVSPNYALSPIVSTVSNGGGLKIDNDASALSRTEVLVRTNNEKGEAYAELAMQETGLSQSITSTKSISAIDGSGEKSTISSTSVDDPGSHSDDLDVRDSGPERVDPHDSHLVPATPLSQLSASSLSKDNEHTPHVPVKGAKSPRIPCRTPRFRVSPKSVLSFQKQSHSQHQSQSPASAVMPSRVFDDTAAIDKTRDKDTTHAMPGGEKASGDSNIVIVLTCAPDISDYSKQLKKKSDHVSYSPFALPKRNHSSTRPIEKSLVDSIRKTFSLERRSHDPRVIHTILEGHFKAKETRGVSHHCDKCNVNFSPYHSHYYSYSAPSTTRKHGIIKSVISAVTPTGRRCEYSRIPPLHPTLPAPPSPQSTDTLKEKRRRVQEILDSPVPAAGLKEIFMTSRATHVNHSTQAHNISQFYSHSRPLLSSPYYPPYSNPYQEDRGSSSHGDVVAEKQHSTNRGSPYRTPGSTLLARRGRHALSPVSDSHGRLRRRLVLTPAKPKKEGGDGRIGIKGRSRAPSVTHFTEKKSTTGYRVGDVLLLIEEKAFQHRKTKCINKEQLELINRKMEELNDAKAQLHAEENLRIHSEHEVRMMREQIELYQDRTTDFSLQKEILENESKRLERELEVLKLVDEASFHEHINGGGGRMDYMSTGLANSSGWYGRAWDSSWNGRRGIVDGDGDWDNRVTSARDVRTEDIRNDHWDSRGRKEKEHDKTTRIRTLLQEMKDEHILAQEEVRRLRERNLLLRQEKESDELMHQSLLKQAKDLKNELESLTETVQKLTREDINRIARPPSPSPSPERFIEETSRLDFTALPPSPNSHSYLRRSRGVSRKASHFSDDDSYLFWGNPHSDDEAILNSGYGWNDDLMSLGGASTLSRSQ